MREKVFVGLFLVLILAFSLVLAGCSPDSDSDSGGTNPGSGGGSTTLPAPNVTVTKLLATNGTQMVMIAYDYVPEAAGYVLLISTSYSDGFIHYAEGKEYFVLFSKFGFTPTYAFNSAIEGQLSPASAAAFRNANQGFMHMGSKISQNSVGNIAPGSYSYKVYTYAYDGNDLIRSDSPVYSVTID